MSMVSGHYKKLVVEAEAGKRKTEAKCAAVDVRVAKEIINTAAAQGGQRRAETKAAEL